MIFLKPLCTKGLREITQNKKGLFLLRGKVLIIVFDRKSAYFSVFRLAESSFRLGYDYCST